MSSTEVKLLEEEKKDLSNDPNSSLDNSKKSKKKFQMPSSLIIIIGLIFFVTFLTWVLQGKNYDSSDAQAVTTAVGFFSIPQYVVDGFAAASGIIFYLFILGWFIETTIRTGTLESGIKSLIKGMKGKEIILVPLMYLAFSLGGTVFGMQEETLGFYLIIIPLFLLAGFDTMTGLLIVLLGTTTGFASSVTNPFSVGVAADSINSSLNSINGTDQIYVAMGDGMIARLVIFLIFAIVGGSFVTYYAYKVKQNPNLSLTRATHEEDMIWAKETFESEEAHNSGMTKRQVAIISIFGITFLIMFLSLFPWYTFTGADPSGREWSNGISWLFGGLPLFGAWDFPELMFLFIFSTIIISIIDRKKGREIGDAFWVGAKDMLTVGIVIGVARAIPGILSASHLDIFIAQQIGNALNGINSWGWSYAMFFVFGAFGLLIPSTSGLAAATMGIFAPIAQSLFGQDPEQFKQILVITIIVYSIAVGIVNMFIPSQAVVLISMERARVPYGQALKPIGIYMGIMIFTTLAIIIPLLQLTI